jgi:hypothetical protein
MGLARDLERRLEQLVDGLAARLFRGRVHPVELGTRIVREADLAAYDTHAGPGAPNAFVVTMGGDPEPDDAVAAAERELEAVLDGAAAERGWRLEGAPRVRIQFGAGSPSAVTIAPSVEPGDLVAFATLEAPGGRVIPIGANRAVIGRSSTADVHLPTDDVSRQHALLWREAGALWLVDLGSSNGTSVNGEPVNDVIDLIDGDNLTFGATTYVLRIL